MYENLFRFIKKFIEIANPYPSWEVMILAERLYNRQDLHLNLSYTNFTEFVLWDGVYIVSSHYQNQWWDLATCLLQNSNEICENVIFKQYVSLLLLQYVAELFNA